MKPNSKHPLAFVKEMPESEEIDLSKAPSISNAEFYRLLKASGKKQVPKKSKGKPGKKKR